MKPRWNLACGEELTLEMFFEGVRENELHTDQKLTRIFKKVFRVCVFDPRVMR